MPNGLPDFVAEAFDRLGVSCTDTQAEQLACYLARVLEVNQRMNLTAFREPDLAWRRLIVDSLSAAAGMPESAGGRVADLGTGGGFPGIPLAIVRPDLRFTLVETTGKKAAFIAEAASELGLDQVVVANTRAEALGRDPDHRGTYDAEDGDR